ncbi:MAG: hypothetical protein JWM19_4639, partial [Actinomycetia bacterium]|nr:hypothetical protein [Actinomycetes bacterium]
MTITIEPGSSSAGAAPHRHSGPADGRTKFMAVMMCEPGGRCSPTSARRNSKRASTSATRAPPDSAARPRRRGGEQLAERRLRLLPLAGLCVGLATDFKPWALVFLPVAFMLPIRVRGWAVVSALAAIAVAWLPF